MTPERLGRSADVDDDTVWIEGLPAELDVDDVGRAVQPPGRPEHLAATAPDERGRFPGQRFGHRTQVGRFVLRCAHRTIASQLPPGSATSG